MKKFVSMFMALVVAFTMGPMVARADDVCEGENCQANEESLTGLAWCKENLKDCFAYGGEVALNKAKQFAGKAKDGVVDLVEAIRDHNYTQTWENIKNYNYTQGFETAKDNAKWAYDKTVNGTKWLGSEISDKWSNTVGPWFSEKADEAVKFEKQVEGFYNDDLNNQPKWTFWTLMASAVVGALTLGTWLLNLITCCGCGRCRLRML